MHLFPNTGEYSRKVISFILQTEAQHQIALEFHTIDGMKEAA